MPRLIGFKDWEFVSIDEMNRRWKTSMNEEPFDPPAELRERLDAATPTPRDYVLYCKCGWVGQTNAAYAADFMRTHKMRIWRHTP